MYVDCLPVHLFVGLESVFNIVLHCNVILVTRVEGNFFNLGLILALYTNSFAFALHVHHSCKLNTSSFRKNEKVVQMK